MKRKIAKIGPSTLMVSLPNKWAKEQGLKKGDEIDVIEQDNALTISTKKSKTSKKLDIHLKHADSFLTRMISRPYIAGYDELHVTFEDPKVLQKISKTLSEGYMGFIIVEQGPKSCIIKNIAEEYEEELDRFINKTYMSIITFAKESLDLIKKKEFRKLEGLGKVYKITIKFGRLCLRIVNKKGCKNNLDLQSYYPITSTYSIIRSLMHMGNVLISLCEDMECLKPNTKIQPETLKVYRKLVELIEESYMLYKKKPDLKTFYEYKRRIKEISGPASKILRKHGTPDIVIVRKLLSLRGFIYPLARYFYFPE